MLWTILRHLDRERFEPVVVFLSPGPFEREVAEIGIRTYVVPVGRLRQVGRVGRALVALARIMREERPDVILNFIVTAQLYGAAAALLARRGRRVAWWQHDLPGRQPVDRLATLLPARAVLASSTTTAEAQARRRPRRPAFAVLPGIPEPAAAPPAEVGALRAKLGIPDGRAVVGIVGRLQGWKGQHRVLEAVALLRERGRDVHALVVGGTQHGVEAEYEEGLRRRAAQPDLADRVTFTGQVERTGPYFQLMDVAVNASDPEPFGLVVLEAMALGVPALAVGSVGPREILDGGRAGVLVPSGDPEDLAAGIERLIADPELARELAERAQSRYRECFTVERMMHDVETKLAELAEQSPVRAPD